ncbi:MAG TPA: sigma-70 family RNA polymerase sigma factor [Candidatus Limnocylindrales bacterium]|nr:sigma-70 family RNA polymerase sigma factor [Candidatus Limnocylindrales bacterium]
MEPNPFDASYLERLRNRDSETEAHFVNYFEKRLSAKLRAAGLYNGDMYDARQETICRSLKKIYEEKVQLPERLGPFVFGICDNVILEFYRGEKDKWDHDGEIPDLPDPREDAENVARHREHLEMVARVLSRVSDKERKILTAVFLHERDRDEICTEFRITREYLRLLLHRALESARKFMDIR